MNGTDAGRGDAVAVRVVLPEAATDRLSQGLRSLTRRLVREGFPASGGLLGGEFGYGCHYDGPEFMMHPYCWCEREDCPWCAGCTCEGPWRYTIAGREVDEAEHERYWQAFHSTGQPGERGRKPPEPWGVWPKDVLSICLSPCAYCRGEFGDAPNFYHKPTGFKVWWYKYIGRGMEVENPNGVKIRDVLTACRAALSPTPEDRDG